MYKRIDCRFFNTKYHEIKGNNKNFLSFVSII